MSTAAHTGLQFAEPPQGRRAALCERVCDDTLHANRRIVLFDGICVVCSWWVNFVTDHDASNTTTFAPLQSELGAHILSRKGIPPMDSMMLIEPSTDVTFGSAPGEALSMASWHCRSTAALRILLTLHPRWLFALVWILLLIPAIVRDTAYKAFAASRYALFGTLPAAGGEDDGSSSSGSSCRMVTKATRWRFLEYTLRDLDKQVAKEEKDRAASQARAGIGGSNETEAGTTAPTPADVFAAAASTSASIRHETDREMLQQHGHTHDEAGQRAAATESEPAADEPAALKNRKGKQTAQRDL